MNAFPIFNNLLDSFFNNTWEKEEIKKKQEWSGWCEEDCYTIKQKEYNSRFNTMTGSNRQYIKKADIENKNTLFRNNKYGGDFFNSYANQEYTGLNMTQQDVKPFQPLRVKPGLNLGYNENIDQGYNNGLMSRVLPIHQHIDNLRPAHKPQVSLEPDINTSGIKYNKRGQIGEVIYPENKLFELNKKDTERNMNSEIKKHTAKSLVTPYNSKTPLFSNETGTGATNYNYGHSVKSKIQEPKRVDIKTPHVTNIKSENTKFNNYTDSLKNTIKSFMIHGTGNSNISGNNKHTRQNQDNLKHTIKENNILNNNKGNISNIEKRALSQQDELRTQLKEELVNKQLNTIIQGNTNLPVEIQDELRTQLKENLVLLTENTNISTSHKKITTDIQDKLHTTLKELNILNTNNTNLTPTQKKNILHYQNILKTTLKELNIVNKHIAGVSNNKTINYVIDYTDIPANTMKELFCKSYNLGVATGIINKHEHINIDDIPAPTLKEMIVHNNYSGIAKLNNGQYLNVQNSLKETVRSLKSIFYCGIVNGYSSMPNRDAKIELNENMENMEYELNKIIKLSKSNNLSISTPDKLGRFCGKDDNNTFNQLNKSVIKNINNHPNINNIGTYCANDTLEHHDRFFNPKEQLKNNQFVNNLIFKYNK